MKIRIRGNSVRIRLSKPEVATFVKEGYVEERTAFVNNAFVYAVKGTASDTLSADFVNGNLTLYVPASMLQQWASTDLVGLDYNMPLPGGSHLYLLIEKDFKCIDAPITEDQS